MKSPYQQFREFVASLYREDAEGGRLRILVTQSLWEREPKIAIQVPIIERDEVASRPPKMYTLQITENEARWLRNELTRLIDVPKEQP